MSKLKLSNTIEELRRINERRAELLILRMEGYTLEEIGETFFDASRQRAQQIEKMARKFLVEQGGPELEILYLAETKAGKKARKANKTKLNLKELQALRNKVYSKPA